MSFRLRLAASVAFTLVASTSLVAQNPNSGPTSTGQTLTVGITTDGDLTMEETTEFFVSACADLTDSEEVNVVYVIDVSGSMINPNPETGGTPYGNLLPPATIGPEDDLNGDGLEGTTLDAAILGVIALNRSFLTFPNVDVAMVAFANGAVSGDMSPFAGTTDFVSPPNLDDSGNTVPDVEDVAKSLQTVFGAPGTAGFTQFTDNTAPEFSFQSNYDAAIAQANLVLSAQPAGELNIIYFVTDGGPTTFSVGAGSPLQDAVDAGNIINAYGMGTAVTGLCDKGQPLDVIASSTGGACFEVADPGDLAGELVGATAIDELSLVVNGTTVTTVSGPEDQRLCTSIIDVFEFLVAGNNVIEAIATAADGTMVIATEEVAKTQFIDTFYVPKRIRLKPKLNSNKQAKVQVRGTIEVGPDPVDLSTGALVELGSYGAAIPSAEPNVNGVYAFSDEQNKFKILVAHEGGSKIRFKLTIEDDELLNSIVADGPLPVRFVDQNVEVAAMVVMEDNLFQIGKKPGTLLEPEIYFYRCRGRYVAPGKDTLSLRFGIGQGSDIAKGIGDTIPGMTVRCGDFLNATIPGTEFEKKGKKFVFKGNIGGVRKVTYDIGKERMILYAKKLDLGDHPQGAVPLEVELTVGEASTTVAVIMVRQEDQLRY